VLIPPAPLSLATIAYVYVLSSTYVRTRMYMWKCASVCIYVRTYMQWCIDAYAQVYMYLCTHMCVVLCTHTLTQPHPPVYYAHIPALTPPGPMNYVTAASVYMYASTYIRTHVCV
jgi:hypothetical protein